MPAPWHDIDMRSPEQVIDTLRAGAQASLHSAARRGSIDVVGPTDARAILTGDLHDNPVGLDIVAAEAGLTGQHDGPPPSTHLVLHEVIHSGRLIHGLDLSYRSLVKAAALKSAYPEHVHFLLANHELSQISGAGIVKEGVSVVEAFNDGVAYVFGSAAAAVTEAINSLVRSLPLGVRFRGAAQPGAGPDLLCAHSLPGDDRIDRFDTSIIDRPTTEDDYSPRQGSAYLMVWGRDHSPGLLTRLGDLWGVGCFVLGHEKADEGSFVRAPNVVILNSDHSNGVYANVALREGNSPDRVKTSCVRFAGSAQR